MTRTLAITYLMLGIGVLFLIGNGFNQALAQSQGNLSINLGDVPSNQSIATMEIAITLANGTTLFDEDMEIFLCTDPEDTNVLCSDINGTPGGTDTQ